MFSIIAAIGKNRELGKNGDLIWQLPNDLKFFKEQTTGKKVFMGKRTFESLPKKLPNREHFVLTDVNIEADGINLVWDLNEFVKQYLDTSEEVFVIGGGMVYTQMLPYAKRLVLTEVDAECDMADTYFPEFDKNEWKRTVLSKNSDNGINYEHVEYGRK